PCASGSTGTKPSASGASATLLPRRPRCTQINTAHIERLNGTLRGRQARLARRTRNGSQVVEALQ
ncbi:MAG: hypothetical protein ACUVXJ_20045, partial [Phycisphaerae bacterium]